MRLVGADAAADVLDAACGFGRHATALACMGYEVTGVDRSSSLLAHARKLAHDLEHSPLWVGADYTALPFEAESFDVVLSLNTSLGFDAGADDKRALAEFARVLRAAGALVIETNHAGRLLPEPTHQQQQEPFGSDGAILTIETDYDPATGIINTLHTLEHNGQSDTITMSRRIYSAEELAAMLKAVGLHTVKRFGGLDGSPFTEQSRLVLVATS